MSRILRLLAVALLLAAGNAHAVFTVYIYESGGNVIASGSGSINTAGVTFVGTGSTASRVDPANSLISLGPNASILEVFTGVTGAPPFGVGGPTPATTTTGDKVGVAPTLLTVPRFYVSGAPLSASVTWAATTIAGLGLTNGTYTATWPGDSFVVNVGVAPPAPAPVVSAAGVPTLSQWAVIILASIIGLAAAARLRKRPR